MTIKKAIVCALFFCVGCGVSAETMDVSVIEATDSGLPHRIIANGWMSIANPRYGAVVQPHPVINVFANYYLADRTQGDTERCGLGTVRFGACEARIQSISGPSEGQYQEGWRIQVYPDCPDVSGNVEVSVHHAARVSWDGSSCSYEPFYRQDDTPISSDTIRITIQSQ